MKRVITAAVAAALAAGVAMGDDPKPIELSVAPAGHSAPALKWRLIPSLYLQRPGDAAEIYNALTKKGLQRWEELGGQDLADLERQKLRALDATQRKRIEDLLAANASALADLDRAKHCDTCRWKTDFHSAKMYANIELTEIQDIRAFFRLLRLRTRYRAAQGDWQGALGSLQTQFALARHCGGFRCVMGGLVAASMESYVYRDLLEIVQEPKCPNLYWPIASLPDELYDLRPLAEFEIRCMLNHIPRIRDADKLDLSPEEWLNVLQEHIALSLAYPRPSPLRDQQHRVAAVGLMLRAYTPGKAHLLMQGMDAAAIDKMPVGKVVAIYVRDECYGFSDDTLKWVALPPYRIVEHYEQASRENSADERNHLGFTAQFHPAMYSYMMAQWNARHLRTFIQTVEALRAFAAENDGKLPDKLTDVKLPTPFDPYTNAPLVYRKEGDIAILKADHERVRPCFNVTPIQYRIRVVKEKAP